MLFTATHTGHIVHKPLIAKALFCAVKKTVPLGRSGYK